MGGGVYEGIVWVVEYMRDSMEGGVYEDIVWVVEYMRDSMGGGVYEGIVWEVEYMRVLWEVGYTSASPSLSSRSSSVG